MTNLNALREAVAESPKNVPLLLLFAHSCLEELALAEARRVFERVLAQRPGNAEAKVGVARVLFLEGRTSEAVVRAQCVVQEEPGFAPAHLFLSRLYLSEDNHEEAVKHYRKALGINRGMSDPALEKALAAAGRERGGSQRRSGDGNRPRPAAAGDEPFSGIGAGAGADGAGDDEEEDDDDDDEMPSFFEALDACGEAGRAAAAAFSLEEFPRPAVNFSQVGGMGALKEEIRMKIVYPLQRPELFRAYGKRAGGSILLYGPPGCGKTLVSRAIAGETTAQFFEVGLHHVLEMYVGGSDKSLRQIFELARTCAPSVVFLDELDSLAADQKDGRSRKGGSLMQQLLQELDRENATAEGVFVIGATSAPWDLDETVFHPGRFDRKVLVPLPDRKTRKAMFRIFAEDKPIIDLDVNYLAGKTEGFSGADLKAVFDMATEDALRIAIKEDRIVPLTTAMLVQCARKLRPSASQWERKFRETER